MKNNIVSIDAVIRRIEINGYIVCTELNGYMEDYEYDNIIYYLKQYKNLENRINKAIEFIEKNSKQCLTNKIDEQPTKVIGKFMWHIDDLLDILKESGE